ncbi:MAG: DUF296 domain-containing protein [Candidatus Micrarchaeia archaeon]
MRIKETKTLLFIKVEQGEEVIETLTRACAERNIHGGVITGIGALKSATLIAGGSTEKLQPVEKDFSGPIEIASALGNVSEKDGKAYIHLHACLGLGDHTAVAGHLVRGVVSLVGEFAIYKSDKISRRFDERISMWVWDI